MTRKLATFMLLLVCYLLMPHQQVDALKCMEQPVIEDNYEHYDGIVIADVKKITSDVHTNIVELKVKQSFKGIKESSISVSENSDWGTAKTGESYLFFLTQQDSGKWELPLCSPTKLLDEAGVYLTFLQDKEISLLSDPPNPIQLLENDGAIPAPSIADEATGIQEQAGSHLAATDSTSKPTGEKRAFLWSYAAIPLGLVGFAAYGIIRIRAIRRKE